MKKIVCFFTWFLFCASAFASDAEVEGMYNPNTDYYRAPLESATWHFEKGHMMCKIWQTIPNYGRAFFVMNIGREQTFHMDTVLGPSTRGLVIVRSVEPSWRGGKQRELGRVRIVEGFVPFSIDPLITRRMLTHLRNGNFPTFYYDSWLNDGRTVEVSLSPAQFMTAYTQFLECSRELLPFTYKEMEHTNIYFNKNESALNPKALIRLDRIRRYVQEAKPDIKKIVIKGYTDDKGKKIYNYYLSIARAKAVRSYFVDKIKVDPNKLVVRAYGQRFPKGSNDTQVGQERNRRVSIDIYQSYPENVDSRKFDTDARLIGGEFFPLKGINRDPGEEDE